MSKTIIKIKDVSKKYQLGEVGTGTLTHDLHRAWAKLRGKPDPYAEVGISNDRSEVGGEYVWALKDINLEIQEGDIFGLIGSNGAGKSTLLKLLSRVTAPTTGKILAQGRIASLLEVGTGFHPELTGRENIYLNGAIMGMSRQEITKRLDEIVEFSGCAKYIDTPIKRYSSGMTVRLGFSVAAHLDCEILIVDEVLAVGDMAFQKKCFGKMRSVVNQGRTVLFVSHNLTEIKNLCSKGALIHQGKIQTIDTMDAVIKQYFSLTTNYSSGQSTLFLEDRPRKGGTGRAKISQISLQPNDKPIFCGESFSCTITYSCKNTVVKNPLVYFGVYNHMNDEVVHINSRMTNTHISEKSEDFKATIEIINPQLSPGEYRIDVSILDNTEMLDWIEGACRLSIEENDYYQSGYLGPAIQGKILLPHKWTIHDNG